MFSSKKNFFVLSLCALVASSAFMFVGCVAESTDPSVGQVVSFEASVHDGEGYALRDTSFDYYVELVTRGGAHLGYYMPDFSTDASGTWSGTIEDLFADDGQGWTCANLCVSWEHWGCGRFARDCWNTGYAGTATILTIDPTQTRVQAGFSTFDGGYRVYFGRDAGSTLTSSPRVYNRSDRFDTDLVVLNGQVSQSGATVSGQLNIWRISRPVIVTDLTLLTKAQKEKLMDYREISGMSDESFQVSAELVGSAPAAL